MNGPLIFVSPSAIAAPQAAWADRGCNVRWWSDAGLECWVVSDLNGQGLDQFVRLFRSAATPQNP